jgi:hypothetical protein
MSENNYKLPAEFEFLPPDSPLRTVYRYVAHGFDLKPDDKVVAYQQVEPLVKGAFLGVAEREIPRDIQIFVFPYQTLEMFYRKMGGNGPTPAATSFRKDSLGIALVEAGECAKVMYAIGHEVGHLSTTTLENRLHEELKARVFQELWFNELDKPKYNGIGDSARGFLEKSQKIKDAEHVKAEEEFIEIMKSGIDLSQVYKDIVAGRFF